MTLNYIHTLETVLNHYGSSKLPFNLNLLRGRSSPIIMLNDIIHVHGEVGDTVIIGVDDKNQIVNEKFRDNPEVNDLLIKKESIRSMKSLAIDRCETLISEANMIILFGVSLGKTDNQWWKLIGEEMKNREIIILQFLYSPMIEGDPAKRRNLINTIERRHYTDFAEKFGIGPDDESIRKRLFFIVNSAMFNPRQ